MNFNSLFFPAPRDHYSVCTHFGEMMYIPKVYELIPKDELNKRLNRHKRLNDEDTDMKPWLYIDKGHDLKSLKSKINSKAQADSFQSDNKQSDEFHHEYQMPLKEIK